MRLACLSLALFAWTGLARGEGRLAIVNLKFMDAPDGDRAILRAAVERAAREAGLQLVPQTQVQQVESASRPLFDCFVEDRCRAELGRQLEASFLFSGLLSREDGAWVAAVELFDVELATVAKREQVACPRCSAADFERRLGQVTAELIRGARQAPRATLVIRSHPPGAEVRVDDRLVGTSDLEVAVMAGSHTVQFRREGGQPVTLPVEVSARERKLVEVVLPLVAGVPPRPDAPGDSPGASRVDAPKKPPTWWRPQRIAGVTLAAAGLGLVVASIPFFVLDGECSDEGRCLFERDFGAAKLGLLVGGLALAATGAVVVLTTPKAKAQAAIAPLVAPTAAGLVGVVRF